MNTKIKFAFAVVAGLVGFVAALPWGDIVSPSTAALILSGAGGVAAVLSALKIGTTKETTSAK